MKWSENAHNAIEPVYREIISHPFINALMDGTLEQDKFIFYIRQDTLYLAEYCKVLAGIAAKLNKSQHVDALLYFARDTIFVENTLHETFLKNIDKTQPFKASPSCLLYTSYLHKQLANAPVNVAAATVLPCFWIYKRVGDYILQHQKQGQNPYQAWIDTYGGEEYADAVARAITICDELAELSTPEQQRAMTEVFVTATKLEWMFWDSAWRLEQWPV